MKKNAIGSMFGPFIEHQLAVAIVRYAVQAQPVAFYQE